MAYPEVIIPPSVKPESPYEPQLIDDQTTLFSPRLGRGTTQRQLWGDPLWGWKLRYRALSGADRALVRAAILEVRGKAVNIRVTPGQPLRGSFPATEVYTNPDFSNGTTGWSIADGAATVSDRALRVKHNGDKSSGYLEAYQSVSLTQYAAYAARAFYAYGSTFPPEPAIGQFMESNNYAVGARGMNTYGNVVISSGAQSVFPLVAQDNLGTVLSGHYVDIPYVSLARCAFVDNGYNALTYSDQFDNAAWVKGGLSVTANTGTAPDGTTTMDTLTEDTSTGQHYVVQTGPTVSAAGDYHGVVTVRQSVLDRDLLLIVGTTGSGHYGYCYFDLSAGTAGTASLGGSATDCRAFIVARGNFEYECHVIVRLPTSAARADLQIGLVSGGNNTYTGTTGAIYAWRGGVAPAGVPIRPAQTTSAANTGTASQTGGGLHLCGLPASTNGLLLAGDWFEVNGELKQATSSLDSDAAGRGYVTFRPGLWSAPAHGTPVIFNNPMGRFRLASDPRIVENFGVYTDIELDLIEAGP